MKKLLLGTLLLSSTAQAQDPDRVTMKLGEFLKMYEDTKNRPDKPEKPEKAPRHFALVSAFYDGEVIIDKDEPVSAVFKAKLRVDVLKEKGWVKVPLLPATVAVKEAKIAGQTAPLVLEGGYYTLVTDKTGTAFDVDVTLAVDVNTTAGSSGFSFQLVPSGSTDLRLAVPASEDLDFAVANAKLQTDRVQGNMRIVEATLPSTGSLAVRWQREIPEAEKQDPRIYSEVYTLASVGDGLLRAQATVNHTILFAGVDELKAQIPKGMKLLDVRGNGLRDWSLADDGVLTAQLNYAAEGSYALTLDLEQVLDGNTVNTPLVDPLNVERNKGWVGVVALGAIEVAAGDVKNATPIDVRTLPAHIIGRTANPVLLGFKYLGDTATLPLIVEEHDEVDVLVTLLDQADATSMFTRDGRRLTRVAYDVRNNRRQFLRLRLPEGAELWSAAVAGRAVQPAADGDGRLLIPLVRSQSATGGALAAFPVEVVYVESGEGPDGSGKGNFKATMPLADVPTTYVAWTVYAPREAKLPSKTKHFDGSLRRVTYLSRPLGASQVLNVQAQGPAMQAGGGQQADSGALGQGAAPVKVSLPLDGQAVFFEKLLALDEDLWVGFDYKGLKDK